MVPEEHRMAGAVTACVPARAGTILGVTRTDANPTYRRLEQYEPLLRLAVPAVLILFLITLAASAWIQVRDGRNETVLDAINDIDIVASLSAAKFTSRPAPVDQEQAAAQLSELVKGMPAGALAQNRTLLLIDQTGAILAVYPPT
jgi:two-component system, cell cycle sensor histidine kinase PleC